MINIDLSYIVTKDELAKIVTWLDEFGGYLGEGQAYRTDYDTIKFRAVAYVESEEDEIVFRLMFGSSI